MGYPTVPGRSASKEHHPPPSRKKGWCLQTYIILSPQERVGRVQSSDKIILSGRQKKIHAASAFPPPMFPRSSWQCRHARFLQKAWQDLITGPSHHFCCWTIIHHSDKICQRLSGAFNPRMNCHVQNPHSAAIQSPGDRQSTVHAGDE